MTTMLSSIVGGGVPLVVALYATKTMEFGVPLMLTLATCIIFANLVGYFEGLVTP